MDRYRIALIALLLSGVMPAGGCGSEDDGSPEPDAVDGGVDGGSGQEQTVRELDFCQGSTAFVYEPQSGALHAFPDDYFTVDDNTALTGLRLNMKAGENIVLSQASQNMGNLFDDLSTLDGFGTTAGLILTASGEIDPTTLPAAGDGSGAAEASLVLVELQSEPVVFEDFQYRLVSAGDAAGNFVLTVLPMRALRPNTLYGLVATNRVKDMAGDCLAPSETTRQLLSRTAELPELQRLNERFDELIEVLTEAGTIDHAGEISAAVVFTTQHTVEDSVAVADDIRDRSYAYGPVGDCVDGSAGFRTCEGEFQAHDYRVNGRYVDEANPSVQSTYTLKTVTYLPDAAQPPYRTLIFGHGLGGDRYQAQRLAELASPEGFAVVSIDAVNHGEHPHQGDSGMLTALTPIAAFFGIWADLTGGLNWRIDGLQLRDNFRQSTYDKLQLMQLIRSAPDIDGDGSADLGIEGLTYLGVSLGGLMAAELAALAPEIEVMLPVVPGARVTSIISDGQDFSLIVEALKGMSTEGEIAVFFPLLQTLVDRGDPGAYLAHVVYDRLPGFDQATPQVLMSMVIGDTVVPNSANLFYARCLGAPHVGAELLPIGTVEQVPSLPLVGNVDATHTAGVFQYDLISTADGASEPATHSNVATSPEFAQQALHFLQSYFDEGVSEIVDPYQTL